MKKIKIKYTPPFVWGVSVVIAMLLMLTGNSICNEIGLIAGGAAALIVFKLVDFMGTTVEFGEGNVIRCKSVFYVRKIVLDDVQRFSYSLEREGVVRDEVMYSLNLRFYYGTNGVEKCHLLRIKLGEKDTERFIRGVNRNVELMQVYKYAESVYPDKAKGYIEDSGFTE